MCFTSYERRWMEEREEQERKRDDEVARLEAQLKSEAREPELAEAREEEVVRS